MKQRIAIVGGGISGLTAAWLLSFKHDVVLFEKNDYVGGHSHTIPVDFGSHTEWIDTGFMVYNKAGYPELTKFFEHLEIPVQKTNMDFSVSLHDRSFEWASGNLGNVFADWKNIFRISFYRFLREIPRFNSIGRAIVSKPSKESDFDMTIDEFLAAYSFSDAFRDQYLYPMGSLIWSTPGDVIGRFPIRMVLDFFNNHNLLKTAAGNIWLSVCGGSRTYVQKVLEEIKTRGGAIKLSQPVASIIREGGKVYVTVSNEIEEFDAVVMATHADVTQKLLVDQNSMESEILGGFRYQKNSVFAHSDISFMPKRKRAWVAWNFCDVKEGDSKNEMSLTYSMNKLNNIPDKYPVFITINPATSFAEGTVHGEFQYAHPIQSVSGMKSQRRMKDIQGEKNTYYCGCYFGYGFHEDGFVAGKEVAERFGCHTPW